MSNKYFEFMVDFIILLLHCCGTKHRFFYTKLWETYQITRRRSQGPLFRLLIIWNFMYFSFYYFTRFDIFLSRYYTITFITTFCKLQILCIFSFYTLEFLVRPFWKMEDFIQLFFLQSSRLQFYNSFCKK